MEEKLKDKKQELKIITSSYTSATESNIAIGASVLDNALIVSLWRIFFNHNTFTIVEKLNTMDDKTEAVMIEARINI